MWSSGSGVSHIVRGYGGLRWRAAIGYTNIHRTISYILDNNNNVSIDNNIDPNVDQPSPKGRAYYMTVSTRSSIYYRRGHKKL